MISFVWTSDMIRCDMIRCDMIRSCMCRVLNDKIIDLLQKSHIKETKFCKKDL